MCAWYGAHIAQGLPGTLSTVSVMHTLYVRQACRTVSAGEAQRGEMSERKKLGRERGGSLQRGGCPWSVVRDLWRQLMREPEKLAVGHTWRQKEPSRGDPCWCWQLGSELLLG